MIDTSLVSTPTLMRKPTRSPGASSRHPPGALTQPPHALAVAPDAVALAAPGAHPVEPRAAADALAALAAGVDSIAAQAAGEDIAAAVAADSVAAGAPEQPVVGGAAADAIAAAPAAEALEDTGIKLDCVATDILGVSGRAMLDALVGGTTDHEVLADLAKGRLRAKLPALREALEGRFEALHALLIGSILAHIDFLDEQIERLTEAIGEQIAPFEPAVELLCTIPGVKRRSAEVLIAEIGTDMSAFPTAGHLASWAGQCPGNDQSAGKRRSGRTRRGSKWLNQALKDAAMAALRTNDSYLQALYRRKKSQLGHGRALGAVKHSIICAAWHMLSTGETYRDLGGDYHARRNPERQAKRLVAQLRWMTEGHPFDIEEFLARPLVARVAAAGPSVRPVWFLWEEGAFWWITGAYARLPEIRAADPRVALVVDSCDLDSGEVRQVTARGDAIVVAFDPDRARRKLARYLGPEEAAWDERFSGRYLRDPDADTRLVRLVPQRLTARDLSFRAGA